MILSEFMAANTRTLATDKGRFEDWIELRNTAATRVDLRDWALTDTPKNLHLWRLPSTNLPPGGHLLIWASGADQRQPGAPLHTAFRLAAGGKYLALVRPDGSIATEFAPKYPPQSPDVSYGFLPGIQQPSFLSAPTPGTPNESAPRLPGPSVLAVTHSPPFPGPSDPVTITARVTPLLAPIAEVRLAWRAQFHRETNLLMTPAGGSTWTATLPAGSAAPGELLRWRVLATDARTNLSTLPLYGNPLHASRYFGTLVDAQASTPTSSIPVLQLFLPPSQLGGAESESGARGCFFYDGEFYDNVFVKVRGNTTAGFPKKSHRLEFPHDHPFRPPGSGGRIRHTSLMAEYGDPTYLRQHLSFWMQRETGSAAPFHDPVRVQLNGAFWQLAMHSEVLGEELLARHGLDPGGALYKAVGTLTPDFMSTGGFEKKTRRYEGNEDYLELARALAPSAGIEGLRVALFTRMNLPAVINYLAVARLTQEDDDIWANMSLYHDNDGTGEWRPIAFDMNVSWGFSFATGEILAEEDGFRSHPFFGAANVGASQGVNQLYDAVVKVPETRAMLLRRMRSVLDRFWQPPGTAPSRRVIESHIATQTNLFWTEAILDRQKWGGAWMTPRGSTPETMLQAGVKELVERFIEPRREHLFLTHSITNRWRPIGITARDNVGIPEPQPPEAPLRFGKVFVDPEHPGSEFLTLTNPSPIAIDMSGWHLTGRVKFPFPPGTVIPPASELHIVADLAAFRRGHPASKGSPPPWALGNLRGRLGDAGKLSLKTDAGRSVTAIGKE